jgi:hypothetical protein
VPTFLRAHFGDNVAVVAVETEPAVKAAASSCLGLDTVEGGGGVGGVEGAGNTATATATATGGTRVVTDDGNRFLSTQPDASFDLIFVDAFQGPALVPRALRTAAFMATLRRTVNAEDGLVLFNTIYRSDFIRLWSDDKVDQVRLVLKRI